METFKDVKEEKIDEVIYTDNFKKWFGDWEHDPQNSSKVVDDNGRPLVVYHGSTSKGITSFKPSIGQSNFGDYKFGEHEVSYFTGDSTVAEGYTWSHKNSEFGEVYDCYLRIINPFIVDAQGESALGLPKTDAIRSLEKQVLDKIIWRFSDDEEEDEWAYNPELDDINEDLFFLDYKLKENDGYIDLVRMGNNNSIFSGEDTIGYMDSGENVMRGIFSSYEYDDCTLAELIAHDIEDHEVISTDGIVRLLLYYNDVISRLHPYDGAIINDVLDKTDMFGGASNDYIVFYSSGIKSASKNNGDFSLNKHNIYEKEE